MFYVEQLSEARSVFYAAFYWEQKGCKALNWGRFVALGKGLALGTFHRSGPFSKVLGALDNYEIFDII